MSAEGLFRGHVIDRPQHRPGARQFGLRGGVAVGTEAGQAHVQDLDRALGIEQKIPRLYVPVDHTLLVGELQAAGRLQDVVDGLGDGQRPLLLDQGREVAPLDVLHDKEVNAIGFVGIIRGNDIGMAQFGCRFDLALKTRDRFRILGDGPGQHLDGHGSLHAAMLGLEDLPHAARPDLVQDRVVAQDQRLRPALVDFLGLELGEVLAANELLSEFLGVFRVGLGRDEALQLARCDDARIFNLLDELFEGNGHGLSCKEAGHTHYSAVRRGG